MVESTSESSAESADSDRFENSLVTMVLIIWTENCFGVVWIAFLQDIVLFVYYCQDQTINQRVILVKYLFQILHRRRV